MHADPEARAASLGLYLLPRGADGHYADGRPVIRYDASAPRAEQLAEINAAVTAWLAAEQTGDAACARALLSSYLAPPSPPPPPPSHER